MWSYNPHAARRISLGSSLFARHYSGNHYYFLFLPVLRCFSSRGWLSFECCIFNTAGCPIRKSSDITLVCSSPKLIAAYHVLHRLSDPRHPPCALNCFKKFELLNSIATIYFDFDTIKLLSQYVKELFVSKPTNGDVSGFEPLNRLYGYIFLFTVLWISI